MTVDKPVQMTTSTRLAVYVPDGGQIPVFSRFVNGMPVATVNTEQDGPFTINMTYTITELTTPTYFDVQVCTPNGNNITSKEIVLLKLQLLQINLTIKVKNKSTCTTGTHTFR